MNSARSTGYGDDMADTLDEQLTKYLTDAHSIESQALAQMRTAPKIAGDPAISEAFALHLKETEEQERLVSERLAARGGSPNAVKEAVMRLGGKGFVLFARSQPDTPGKLVAHAYSYEHLELASYELLIRVAERAGDEETVAVARRIRDQEAAMAERLEGLFDAAAQASLRAQDPDDLEAQLVKYLADAHAIEAQAEQLLKRGRKIAGHDQLAALYEEHLDETRGQQVRLEERLKAHDSSPSRLKDAAMRIGALNWGAFFQAQPDTPGKLCAFAYAFEHLEIGGQEQLLRVARRAGDEETVRVVEGILAEERSMAARLAASFDRAVDASLAAVGATA
jgi:ferritin-like metal-binding protein YciE